MSIGEKILACILFPIFWVVIRAWESMPAIMITLFILMLMGVI